MHTLVTRKPRTHEKSRVRGSSVFIDPCSGSGHILVYMFDVLMQIYESYGYTTREAVASIVENNLYGLDIDDRAAQLAYFAVMMKARQYDRRFFSRGIQPHVYAIAESNHVDSFALEYFCNGDAKLKKAMDTIISELHDAKEYGSILTVTQQDWSALYARFAEIEEDIYISREAALSGLLPLVQTAQALAQKYDTVVTNPPYMAVSNADAKVNDYVKKNFPDSKADLFAVFIERCGQMAKKNGYQAMITQHSWMFLSSFEKLRTKLLVVDIVNMAHLGARAFEEIGGEVVQTTAFVIRKSHIADYKGEYCRLIEPTSQQGKENMFLDGENRYNTDQSNFSKIPGSPVAYWVSAGLLSAFATGKSLGDIALARNGMKTGENGRFVRLWWEVILQGFNSTACDWKEASSSGAKWFPYNKGGEFRKWYGNNDCIVNWQNELELKFKPSASWSLVTSGQPAFRYKENNLSDIAGMSFFTEKQELLILLGFCNSKIALEILKILAPTINFQAGDIGRLPIVDYGVETDTIRALVTSNIDESALDWDSFETSWDFRHHPLLRKVPTIAEAFDQWQAECDDRFNQLKANEEELNRIFIDIYGLQNELTPEVEDKDVTVRRADLGRDIRSFISYAVGCMFGRYSLDVDGLAYAGGEWDASKYASFAADKDNIIPICDDEYFDDDIVGRFVEFVRKVYGDDTLEENLKFVADALGGKGQPKDVIRNYFLSDFYSDHCKIYQKRPIYWLFDSGKKNGFKALIYMHRYKPDIIARMRTDYVHEQQGRYRTAIADLESRIANADTGSRVKLTKQLTKLQNQAEELRVYEEKIHHLADQMIRIDLDDGVKHNYAIFQDVLAKIK